MINAYPGEKNDNSEDEKSLINNVYISTINAHADAINLQIA
ncbi:hypothetical protein [Bacillus sp. AFS088145]|nr:hypothetical protein [Bacillus sp. AFS088145]